MLSFTGNVYAQIDTTYIQNNVFYTTVKNGLNQDKIISFPIDTIKIIQSLGFILWEKNTFNDTLNIKYIEHIKNIPKVYAYLNSKVWTALFYGKMKLKNQTSFNLIENAPGYIMITDAGGLSIKFPIQAQNGYGNLIYSNVFYTEKLVDNKFKGDSYIFD